MGDSFRSPVVGIDLGGTSIKAALVSPELDMLVRAEVPTDISSQSALLDEIERTVRQVAGGSEFAAAGFGLPSQIDQRSGRVADSTNVPIVDVPFGEEMRRRLGVPTRVDNDANAACLAETRIGAAKGAQDVIMLTLGTGVGGGLVLGGELYRGANGFAGELGHMVVDEHGPSCQGHCPNRGCLEALASSSGLLHAAAAVADSTPGGTLAAAYAGGEPLTPRWVLDRAMAGDPDCVAAVARVGRHVGVAISSFVNIFNPEVVVIGGGLAAAGDLLLGPAIREAGARALPSGWSRVRVVPAELGNTAGVLGAAALVL
jgi:glucokinase